MRKIVNMTAIKTILAKSVSLSVIGLSPKVNRSSNMVDRYLLEAGYTAIPVNQGHDKILEKNIIPA
jgi:predicted CoA-binding protein